MHLPALIRDLAVILLTGGIVTVLFKKINQPLVLGYILAGFLIGPYMPLFFDIADSESISTWSEIGIIILMFGLGLEFNLHKLVKVGGTGLITALTEVGGMLVLGYIAGQLMGWGVMDSVFLGGMLSMSSTTIIIKAFDDLGVRKEKFAELVFGTLVIEDIAGIFMMIILSTVSAGQNVSGAELALTLGSLVLYLALWLILGIYLLPTLLQKATPLMSDETLLVSSLGLCFGMVLLADALGFSSALGAFLAGSLLAGTVHAERVEHLTQGVKDLFGAVFFISVGMMIDPEIIVQYAVPIIILSLLTMVGKLIFSSLGVLMSGHALSTAVHCGCSLAQIGEFAFIIASLGLSLGVIADFIYPVIIAVSVITTLTTPMFIKNADKIYGFIARLLPDAVTEKLERYTDEDQSTKTQNDGDWTKYLWRYARVTAFYGIIMAGISIMGRTLLLPALQRAMPGDAPARWICLGVIYLGIALFVRPMLDTRSAQFTALWVKKRGFRLPLMALAGLRVLLIAFIAFIPLQQLTGASSLWLIPVLAAAVLLCFRSDRLSSLYLRVEAQFLANLNERQLSKFSGGDEGIEWLDEQLAVDCLTASSEEDGKTLAQLGWGRRYGANVIHISRGRRQISMPSGDAALSAGDRLYIVGERDKLRALRLELDVEENADMPSLRSFITGPDNADSGLYSYALAVEKGSSMAGRSIRSSGIREKFDCMILGLQRGNLPLAQPDVEMTIESGDIVWLLGTEKMAGKLLKEIAEE